MAQRSDEQQFKIADGLLTLKSGQGPKVRQVRDPLALGVHPSAPWSRGIHGQDPAADLQLAQAHAARVSVSVILRSTICSRSRPADGLSWLVLPMLIKTS